MPNQSGSSIIGTVDNSAGQSATVPVASSAEVLHPPQQQHSEATSSGSATQPESGSISSVVMSQASPSVPTSFARGRHVPPLCRQQQHLVLVSQDHKNKHRNKYYIIYYVLYYIYDVLEECTISIFRIKPSNIVHYYTVCPTLTLKLVALCS